MVSSKANEVLEHIERAARIRYLPIIGSERGQILVNLVRRHKPRRILEVGTLVGYSTILLGKELGNEAEIVTIEIDSDEAELAMRHIQEARIKPIVRVLVGDASDIILELDGSFDMVFLDGDKGDYLDHLRLIENKLHRGSVIVADNAGAFAYSMRDYLNYVRKSGRYDSRLMRAGGDGIEVSLKL